MNDEMNKQIEFLKDYYEGLKKTIAERRKQGMDTKMAELRMMNIPQKIKYVEVSEDKKDIRKLKVLLSKLEKEIPKSESAKK